MIDLVERAIISEHRFRQRGFSITNGNGLWFITTPSWRELSRTDLRDSLTKKAEFGNPDDIEDEKALQYIMALQIMGDVSFFSDREIANYCNSQR